MLQDNHCKGGSGSIHSSLKVTIPISNYFTEFEKLSSVLLTTVKVANSPILQHSTAALKYYINAVSKTRESLTYQDS